MKPKIDYSLYLVTDVALSKDRSVPWIVEQAIQGGVTVVQYRQKSGLSARKMLQEILELQAITRNYSIPLIINDRLDLLLASASDGIHIGQEDLPAHIVRGLIPPECILGVSIRNIREAENALMAGADYLAISGLFSTQTKPDVGSPLGLDFLKETVAMSPVPVVAIGGISVHNARTVLEHGAAGIAVVSAIISSDNPFLAAEELRSAGKNRR